MALDEISEKIHIVLIDDEPRIHEMISDVLKNAGLAKKFDSFFDPLSFLEFLKQDGDSIDLILLDVHFENSGLTGVEIIPYIREDYPYLPIVLLTGMEGEEIEDAQDFECTYYIPKPVDPDHLVRMVRFYLGMGRKSGQRIADLSQDLADYKDLLDLLEEEVSYGDVPLESEKSQTGLRQGKAFDRIIDILFVVLKNCEAMPSFVEDLKKLYHSDFKIFKKAMSAVIHFDLANQSSPGLDIHKFYGVNNIYSLRLTRKARLFYYQSQQAVKKRLLRVDQGHETKAMEKWFKSNSDSYEGL
jgi:CheY-like chemotaxis protein